MIKKYAVMFTLHTGNPERIITQNCLERLSVLVIAFFGNRQEPLHKRQHISINGFLFILAAEGFYQTLKLSHQFNSLRVTAIVVHSVACNDYQVLVLRHLIAQD